jgi:hypothetical protein
LAQRKTRLCEFGSRGFELPTNGSNIHPKPLSHHSHGHAVGAPNAKFPLALIKHHAQQAEPLVSRYRLASSAHHLCMPLQSIAQNRTFARDPLVVASKWGLPSSDAIACADAGEVDCADGSGEECHQVFVGVFVSAFEGVSAATDEGGGPMSAARSAGGAFAGSHGGGVGRGRIDFAHGEDGGGIAALWMNALVDCGAQGGFGPGFGAGDATNDSPEALTRDESFAGEALLLSSADGSIAV